MKIEVYGLVLKEVGPDDIELLRSWRTSEKINQFMIYRGPITEEMQAQWFTEVSQQPNVYYFIVYYLGKPIGMLHGTEAGHDAEGGLFFYDDKYWDTYVPVLAALCINDWALYFLSVNQMRGAKIRKDNHRALTFNKQMGYVLSPQQPDPNSDYWLIDLHPDNYEAHAEKLRKAARVVTKQNDVLTIYLDETDRQKGRIERFQQLYEQLNPKVRHRFVLVVPS